MSIRMVGGRTLGVVILTLLLGTVTGLAPSTASGEEPAFAAFTHTVFAEFSSATW